MYVVTIIAIALAGGALIAGFLWFVWWLFEQMFFSDDPDDYY